MSVAMQDKDTSQPLPTVVSFWHGPLSWLERLSIASFRRAGHRVEVYSYDPIEGLPEGAVARDATEILPRDRLVFYKGKGTPAVFSDLFRLHLLKAERGIWSDLDVYCLRPLPVEPGYLMGYERPGSINNAVLRIPADSPLLDDLLGVFETGHRPLFEPHLPLGRRVEVALRRLIGQPMPPEAMQFGATGPFALTYYAQQRGLDQCVLPSAVFYPVPYTDIPGLMQPGGSLESFVQPETLAIHIWRSQLTRRGRAGLALPEEGSILHMLCRREEIELA